MERDLRYVVRYFDADWSEVRGLTTGRIGSDDVVDEVMRWLDAREEPALKTSADHFALLSVSGIGIEVTNG